MWESYNNIFFPAVNQEERERTAKNEQYKSVLQMKHESSEATLHVKETLRKKTQSTKTEQLKKVIEVTTKWIVLFETSLWLCVIYSSSSRLEFKLILTLNDFMMISYRDITG